MADGKYYEVSKHHRERGKAGENKGIPIDLPKFRQYIPNIQKGKYYLISMDSGVGKTKFSNYLFMYTPFFKWLDTKGKDFNIDINYYTAEMPIEDIIAELQAFWLFRYHKILLSTDDIYSMGQKQISPKVDKLLDSQECVDMINLFEDKVRIVNESFGYKYIYKQIIASAEKHGDITWGEVDGDSTFVDNYKEHDPNMFCINILDNFQRLRCTNGESSKHTIDELSRRMDWARQKFNQIWVGLQQLNRNTKNLDRYKLEQFFPGPESLKDSENPYHDCQCCIVGISPKALDLKTFDGYNIAHNSNSKGFMDRLRPIRIIKNRGGISNKVGYLLFLGENAYFKEVAEPEKWTKSDYDTLYRLYKP